MRSANGHYPGSLRDEFDAACCDITTVYLLRVEVDPRDHEVTPSYKASLVCTIRLDGEDPFHWYKMLTGVWSHY